MAAQYRATRRRVWEQGTRADRTPQATHASNQQRLRAAISQVCSEASLANYAGNDDATVNRLWWHLWSKPLYAGIKAQIASNSIATLEQDPGSFNDWQMFLSSDWDIPRSVASAKHVAASNTGLRAKRYLMKEGEYSGRPVIAKVSKLRQTVVVARSLDGYLRAQAGAAPAINFVSGGETDPWRVFDRLQVIGINGALTRLHIMMDLGYPVVKPDIVLTSLFLKLGWLHFADSSLPVLGKADLHGKGQFGAAFQYDQPRMFKLVIDTARQIVATLSHDELQTDIGWVTANPLREFDLFMVKAGQKPEAQYGILTIVEGLEA